MRFHEFNEAFSLSSLFGGNNLLTSISPPTGDRGPEVADIQKVLKKTGYGALLGNFGNGGVDGIRGKYTTNAISQFQQDKGLPNTAGAPDAYTIGALNQLLKDNPDWKIPKSTASDVTAGQPLGNIGNLGDIDTSQAKGVAEQYLGRKLSDTEWTMLVKATAAEASNNPTEQAYVMGVILNRVTSGKWGNTVTSVLQAPNQFQAVTGTSHNPGPSSTFSNPGNRINSVLAAAVKVLPSVPHNLMNFTAASSGAYGPGTNIGYRNNMIAKGGKQIGGTIFA